MSDLNEVTEAVNARYMAKRLGLPQPGLFLTEDEVIHDVKARFDVKDARIAELEALTQPFTESELARAEGVLNIAMRNVDGDPRPGMGPWLRSTIQAVVRALVEDRK